MKSDHRHELKTNLLADWLSHMPEWAKENLVTIIIVVVLIVAIAAFYGWRLYSKNIVQAGEQTEFTNLLNQISSGKMQILQGQQSQGRDFSFVLLQPANSLQTFAQKTSNKRMAALALIKRAEALRAELHYGNVEEQYFINQTNLAKASYAEALEKCPTNPSLAASAKFGLGLCAEELGHFEQAKAIYQDIAEDPEFKHTLAAVRAKRRLQTMADYQKNIIFKPAPKTPESETQATGPEQLPNITAPFNIYRPLQFDMLDAPNEPAVPGTPYGETNQPTETHLPVETTPPADSNLATPTTDDISVQIIPLPNKDVLALSAEEITQILQKAGFSDSQLLEHITEIRDGLAKSGAVQIKVGNKVEAVFAINLTEGNRVYISTRRRGNFIYNVNESGNIPKAPDVNVPEG
jgi:tetratricopeptide (TPR) repeat protein